MKQQGAIDPSLRSSLRTLSGPLLVLAIVIAAYLLIPLLIILPTSLTDRLFLSWPPELFSFRWFRVLFESPTWTRAMKRSIEVALPATLLSTFLGTTAALGMTTVRRWRRSLQTLFIAPLVVPPVAYALGVYTVAGRLGWIGTIWPVVWGHVVLATPLVFLIVGAALANRDRNLPRAASSLGANWLRVVWRIELPLARNSVMGGALLAFAFSFDEIVVAYFLSTPGVSTLPVQILSATREAADPTVAAASIFVMSVALVIGVSIIVIRRISAGGPT